jgi:hypothetical protein
VQARSNRLSDQRQSAPFAFASGAVDFLAAHERNDSGLVITRTGSWELSPLANSLQPEKESDLIGMNS